MKTDEVLEKLSEVAGVLELLREDPNREIHYEIFADGIYWSDEVPDRRPASQAHAWQALRFVLRYRTSLILSEPDDRFRAIWVGAKELFPHWIGFASSRCTPDDETIAMYKNLRDAAMNDVVSGITTESPKEENRDQD